MPQPRPLGSFLLLPLKRGASDHCLTLSQLCLLRLTTHIQRNELVLRVLVLLLLIIPSIEIVAFLAYQNKHEA